MANFNQIPDTNPDTNQAANTEQLKNQAVNSEEQLETEEQLRQELAVLGTKIDDLQSKRGEFDAGTVWIYNDRMNSYDDDKKVINKKLEKYNNKTEEKH